MVSSVGDEAALDGRLRASAALQPKSMGFLGAAAPSIGATGQAAADFQAKQLRRVFNAAAPADVEPGARWPLPCERTAGRARTFRAPPSPGAAFGSIITIMRINDSDCRQIFTKARGPLPKDPRAPLPAILRARVRVAYIAAASAPALECDLPSASVNRRASRKGAAEPPPRALRRLFSRKPEKFAGQRRPFSGKNRDARDYMTFNWHTPNLTRRRLIDAGRRRLGAIVWHKSLAVFGGDEQVDYEQR